jgi:hypothetical protein
MEQERATRDPGSGYASADALEPMAGSEQDEPTAETQQDSMSGYMSADVLDPEAPINRDRTHGGEAGELRDAMSGYGSADAFDPDADDSA